MPEVELLFSNTHINDIKRAQNSALQEEIGHYTANKLLNTSTGDLVEYFLTKYSLDVPSMLDQEIEANQKETQIDMSHDFRYNGGFNDGPVLVTGATVEIKVPFQGDRDFFFIQPNPFSMNPPRAVVLDTALLLRFTGVNQKSDQLKQKIDASISEIEQQLVSLRSNVREFNLNLSDTITTQLEGRKIKLLQDQNLVESLGFKLKKNPQSQQAYKPPSVRRKMAVQPPKAKSTNYVPEPALPGKDFDYIISVVQNMAQVMERSPSAFKNMDEEDLRTHFLVQLNGHFEGQATGETFNYNGKTDILIREEDRNVFIGECKFWGGARMLSSTIDQLLGYSSWRDTKVALLIFNRNKDFSKTIETAHSTMLEHANYKKFVIQKGETDYRYKYSNRDDLNRELDLALLLFDVPV